MGQQREVSVKHKDQKPILSTWVAEPQISSKFQRLTGTRNIFISTPQKYFLSSKARHFTFGIKTQKDYASLYHIFFEVLVSLFLMDSIYIIRLGSLSPNQHRR